MMKARFGTRETPRRVSSRTLQPRLRRLRLQAERAPGRRFIVRALTPLHAQMTQNKGAQAAVSACAVDTRVFTTFVRKWQVVCAHGP
eukprot:654813-Pleurochrysis_carterae.AAC.1